MQVYDGDGNELAEFAISEKQQKILDAGEEIVVLFHTPQLLRGALGANAGSFALRKINERIVAQDVTTVRKYAALQQAIKKTREPPK